MTSWLPYYLVVLIQLTCWSNIFSLLHLGVSKCNDYEPILMILEKFLVHYMEVWFPLSSKRSVSSK